MLAGIFTALKYGRSTTSSFCSSRAKPRLGDDLHRRQRDGARKGRVGLRSSISGAVGSWIAGTFGVIVLTQLIAPPLATLALKVGPPEYTALLVLVLLFLAYMSSHRCAQRC